MNLDETGNGGTGFFGLMTILFIALKILGHISWSWWLVLLPAYAGFIVLFFLIILAVLIGK